tara:strand:+ start:4632 stop:5552 length:921 start_codon:yes stop_codon:yes gene_type:complete
MSEFKILKQLLNEDCKKFPAKVPVICGKTLAKTGSWLKAVLLVKTKFGQTEKYQLRLYGWQKNKEGIWKQRQKFNISPSGYLGDMLNIFQVFIQESLKKGEHRTIFEKLANRIASLQTEINKISSLEQKNQIPIMESKIKSFDKLLRRKKRKEKELQKFLYKQYWMFGSHYKSVHKEKWAGMKGRNDFLIEKEAGYFDIVELKKPEHSLFTKGKLPTMSKDLKNAISQMAKYFDYYHKHYLSHKEQTKMDILYPKGIIVIGRRNEKEKEVLKAHELIWGSKVEILTYDDILDRAKQSIKNIKKRKK